METPLLIDAVLFDLDGTLLDTIPDLHAAACALLRDLGRREPSIEETRSYVGRGMQNLVKRLLAGSLDIDYDEPAPSDAMEIFRAHYQRENGRQASYYPGVIEGLTQLKSDGYKLAIITNKPIGFTRTLLAETKLSEFFEVVVGDDSLPQLKPNPMPLIWTCGRLNVSPDKALFIGDSVNDLKAARAAHCPIFLLPYGYNEGRDVNTLDADAIIPTVLDALPLIQRAG